MHCINLIRTYIPHNLTRFARAIRREHIPAANTMLCNSKGEALTVKDGKATETPYLRTSGITILKDLFPLCAPIVRVKIMSEAPDFPLMGWSIQPMTHENMIYVIEEKKGNYVLYSLTTLANWQEGTLHKDLDDAISFLNEFC
jgi:hypothetical protein